VIAACGGMLVAGSQGAQEQAPRQAREPRSKPPDRPAAVQRVLPADSPFREIPSGGLRAHDATAAEGSPPAHRPVPVHPGRRFLDGARLSSARLSSEQLSPSASYESAGWGSSDDGNANANDVLLRRWAEIEGQVGSSDEDSSSSDEDEGGTTPASQASMQSPNRKGARQRTDDHAGRIPTHAQHRRRGWMHRLGVTVPKLVPWPRDPAGFKWKEVGTERPQSGTEIRNSALAEALRHKTEFSHAEWEHWGRTLTYDSYIKVVRASGLTWKKTGATMPTHGREVSNAGLATALKNKTEFTQQEWAAFGLSDLRSDDFIEADGSYFRPSAATFFRPAGNIHMTLEDIGTGGGGTEVPFQNAERSAAAQEDKEVILEQSSRGKISLFGPTLRCHWQDTTRLHERCEVGDISEVRRVLEYRDGHAHQVHFQAGHIFRRRHPDDHSEALKTAAQMVYTPNTIGQLPLHVAARTNRVREDDAGMIIDEKRQPGPDLVSMLLSGKDVSTGEVLFNVRTDETGKNLSCLHQDVLGMTPLHVACRSDCTDAKQVVARLIEANPGAARIADCDGLLPLGHAVCAPFLLTHSCDKSCFTKSDRVLVWDRYAAPIPVRLIS